jgi:hypothetical protein
MPAKLDAVSFMIVATRVRRIVVRGALVETEV